MRLRCLAILPILVVGLSGCGGAASVAAGVAPSAPASQAAATPVRTPVTYDSQSGPFMFTKLPPFPENVAGGSGSVSSASDATIPPAAAPQALPQVASTVPEISISGNAFVPNSVRVAPGTKVTWTQLDTTTHTVTARDRNFDSRNLARGASFSMTFSQPGSYVYYCDLHPFMIGTIVVQ